MAVYRIFPTQDATLYSLFPSMNTGLDEIIEATTTTFAFSPPNPQVSRFVMQFSQTEINNLFSRFNLTGSTWDSYLNCYIATVTGLGTASIVETFPLAKPWNMGTGKYLDNPITSDGCSWQFTNYSGSNQWTTPSASGANSIGFFTSSFSGSNVGGGLWYTGSNLTPKFESTQSLAYGNDVDLSLKVTNIITNWYSGSSFPEVPNQLPNYGFILKQTSSQEFVNNPNQQVELKYFSVDTNTIYPPNLEFRWDDSVFNTGSSTQTIITGSQIYVSLDNNNGTFYSESVQRFRINCRPQYPARAFQTSSIYTTNYYLPPNISYYAVKDLDTNEFVVPFNSTYTKISADVSSSYFDIYMNGLQPERYYQILLQTTVANNTIVLNNDYYFKVVTG
jgi:hypothetical protein